MHSLNCVILITYVFVISFVSTLFLRTNTDMGKEHLTLLFTLELEKVSCP